MQLELGAAAPPFEDRGLRVRASGTIVRVRGAGSGAHPAAPRIFPGLLPAPRRNPATGELTRTIVRLPDRTGHGPAVPARRSAWIKKFILGVDTLYSMG